ncbi:hypothetical protein MicB006_3133 [Micromonospora sp. B006]|nr:hypothetical protein MicB006_3133 [Micromonospora sp. B006]
MRVRLEATQWSIGVVENLDPDRVRLRVNSTLPPAPVCLMTLCTSSVMTVSASSVTCVACQPTRTSRTARRTGALSAPPPKGIRTESMPITYPLDRTRTVVDHPR